jgi:hypothetical protein
MRQVIYLISLLAACSGGHGEAPYVPSEDLIASHPFLFGGWNGLAHSNAGGAPIEAYCLLLSPNPQFPSTATVQSAGLNTVFAGSGSYTAGGDRTRIHANEFGGAGESLEFDLRIANQQTLTGTYLLTLANGQPRDSGTVELSKTSMAPLLVIEDYETPELRLRIVRAQR